MPRPPRLLAAVLIVLTVLGTNGWWHLADDDSDFLQSAAIHNHSTHHEQLRSQQPPGSVDHCAICHWLQAFRSDSTRTARVFTVALAAPVRPVAMVRLLRSPLLLELPSRAPPA